MKTTMNETLRNKIRDEYLRMTNNEADLKYYMGKLSGAVELENGGVFVFEKPVIDTYFCYGYGQCGMSTEEDYQSARAMSEAALQKENFIANNFDKYSHSMGIDFNDGETYYATSPYRRSSYFKVLTRWCHLQYADDQNATLITERDKTNLKAEYERQCEMFRKRLETYWKRYGASKLKTWTYLVD